MATDKQGIKWAAEPAITASILAVAIIVAVAQDQVANMCAEMGELSMACRIAIGQPS